jgi:hypothetical protein
MENKTADFADLEHNTNTRRHVWLVLRCSDNWDKTLGTDVYFALFYLVKIFLKVTKIYITKIV